MALDRRDVLRGSALVLGAGAALAAGEAAAVGPKSREAAKQDAKPAAQRGPGPESTTDALQAAIDRAASKGVPLNLEAGTYRTGRLNLPSGVVITGVPGRTVLEMTGRGGALLLASAAEAITLRDLTLDGNRLALDANVATGLIMATECRNIRIEGVTVRNSLLNGITLERCSGVISDCTVERVSMTAIFSRDAEGLEITHCHVRAAANNGIQVWRSTAGIDGTIVSLNRIEGIDAKSGGSGENGNGVNVYRAGNVLVANNRISGCAYSAVRGNAAADIQILGNSCSEIGEVALYAEFGFEGAVISGNLVDGAASGISVTNFNEGGRLAVVQGNLIRNLRLRPQEPVDKRGDGIAVEADAVVSGNVVENAPGIGIAAGWGRYLRDVVITGNLVRSAGQGIVVSVSEGAGTCLVTQNIVKSAKSGAIIASDHGKPAKPEDNPRLVITGNITS